MVRVWLEGGQGEVRGACAPPPPHHHPPHPKSPHPDPLSPTNPLDPAPHRPSLNPLSNAPTPLGGLWPTSTGGGGEVTYKSEETSPPPWPPSTACLPASNGPPTGLYTPELCLPSGFTTNGSHFSNRSSRPPVNPPPRAHPKGLGGSHSGGTANGTACDSRKGSLAPVPLHAQLGARSECGAQGGRGGGRGWSVAATPRVSKGMSPLSQSSNPAHHLLEGGVA